MKYFKFFILPCFLVELVSFRIQNPETKIQINGYTDNIGTPADNLKLSTGRALAVVNYLLYKGVRKERLSYKGFGEADPIATNETEQGRAMNRRTELRVVSN